MDAMESLRSAIARLERAGYTEALRAHPGGFRELHTGRIHPPESMIVDEIVRFEGESDPGDEAVLFALRTPDGRLRATFVATYGPTADPLSAPLMRRLDGESANRRSRPKTASGSAGSSSARRP